MKKLRSFAIENAGRYLFTLRIAALIALLALLNPGGGRARSWSYHYVPRTPQPSPVAAPTMAAAAGTGQLSTARLLKRAIVSDLAILIQEQSSSISGTERPDHSKYIISRLLLYDPMNSPEALRVFASLSGYYLGARADRVCHCLMLRKGKTIEPLLAEQLRGGELECVRELGQEFENPSSALDGKALCRSRQDQTAFLTGLIAEIDSGRTCSNDELAAIGR